MNCKRTHTKIPYSIIQQAFERYQSGSSIKSLSEPLGITPKCLRMRFSRHGLNAERKGKKVTEIIDKSPFKPIFDTVKPVEDKPSPKFCGTCTWRETCSSGTERFDKCYFVESPVKKPNYVKDTSMF